MSATVDKSGWARTEVTCAGCGESFAKLTSEIRRRPEAKHYCSQQCWLRRHNSPERNRALAQRNHERAVERHGLAGLLPKSKREQGPLKSYRKLGHRHEHRIIAERILGRQLEPGEVVHHVNGDRLDNRPENLQVLSSQAEHARIHAARGMPSTRLLSPIEATHCVTCDDHFELSEGQRRRARAGRVTFYCSLRCYRGRG